LVMIGITILCSVSLLVVVVVVAVEDTEPPHIMSTSLLIEKSTPERVSSGARAAVPRGQWRVCSSRSVTTTTFSAPRPGRHGNYNEPNAAEPHPRHRCCASMDVPHHPASNTEVAQAFITSLVSRPRRSDTPFPLGQPGED